MKNKSEKTASLKSSRSIGSSKEITDGVQLEPAGMWIGNSDGSASNVSIYKVRSSIWIWDWFNSHAEYTDAPENDYTKAVKYADDQRGKGYNWFFLKDVETTFYCSSLVYKSWRQISPSYDMSFGFFVTPADIASSDKIIA